MRGRHVLLGLTLVVLTMGGFAPHAVANVGDELQLVARSSPDQGRVVLDVAVPERFTGATLPDGSFTVLAGDQRLVVATTPIPATSLSVLVILDTGSTVPTASFDRQRAAVAELARAIEPGTRLGLATTTSPFRLLDATDDRPALMTALGNVAVGGTASPVEAVAAATGLAGADPGARAVLFVDDAATSTDQLVSAAGGLRTDVVLSGGAAATTTDGVLRVHHVNHPLQYVDGLAAELTGQFRLDVTLPQPPPEALTVRLDAGGLAFELPVTLSTASTDAGAGAGTSTPSPTVAAVSQARASLLDAAAPTTSPPSASSAVSVSTVAPATSAPTTQAHQVSEADDTSLLFWVAVIATPVGLALMIIALFARRSASRPRRRRRGRRAKRRASPAKHPLLVPRPTSVDDDLVEDELVVDGSVDELSPDAPSGAGHAVEFGDVQATADERSQDDALDGADELADEAPTDDDALTDDEAPTDEALTDAITWADDPGADEVPADASLVQGAPTDADALVDEAASSAPEPQPLPPEEQPAPPGAAVPAGPATVPVEHANTGTTQAHRRAHRWPGRRVASVTMMVASDLFLRRRHHRP